MEALCLDNIAISSPIYIPHIGGTFASGSFLEVLDLSPLFSGFGLVFARQPHHALLKLEEVSGRRAMKYPASPNDFYLKCHGPDRDQQHRGAYAKWSVSQITS
jgi:hypothetical protein